MVLQQFFFFNLFKNILLRAEYFHYNTMEFIQSIAEKSHNCTLIISGQLQPFKSNSSRKFHSLLKLI